jgi:DNA modification methylase
MNLICGDALEELRKLDPESVQCCVTSPPYWSLRDYGVDGQLGLERTYQEYVEKISVIFEEVRRVLRKDGSLWLNIGDVYNSYNGNRGNGPGRSFRQKRDTAPRFESGHGLLAPDLKPKDLVGIPWRVAFRLQADGWYLRRPIVWEKPNVSPESTKDRPVVSYEFLFLMSKSRRYYFDGEAIKEPAIGDHFKYPGTWSLPHTKDHSAAGQNIPGKREALRQKRTETAANTYDASTRNKRDVWRIPTQGYAGAHFAVFPEGLVEPCILAGSQIGAAVLDPFLGSGTTGVVAMKHDRDFVGIDLNPEYIEMARTRIAASTAQQRLPV